MSSATRYTFQIKKFTPENMPFGRLVEYYAQIKQMTGVADNLHLLEIAEGSHSSTFAIEPNHQFDLNRRIVALRDRTAPRNALHAHDKINVMLTEDGTSGVFSNPAGDNVIVFPGQLDESDQVQIRDAATFSGELYYINGTKTDVKVRIKTEAYGVVSCATTKDIARKMRVHLFDDIKVNGRGMWTRGEAGKWDIDDFTITDFAPIKRENLRDAVNRIRNVKMKWPDDPLGEIRMLEEKDEPIQ